MNQQQQQQQESVELGNKRNQTRLLEQIHDLTIVQQQQLLINILRLPKNDRKTEILQMLRIIMKNVDFFMQFYSESSENEAYDYCLKNITIDSFAKNTVIFEKGEIANHMYTVLSGQVSLYSNDHLTEQIKTRRHSYSVDQSKESQHSQKIKYSEFKVKSLYKLTEFKEWKTFGEQSIIEERPRTNIALCDKETILAIFSKCDYLCAISIMEKKKELKQMNHFRLHPSFQGLNKRLLNFMLFSFPSQEYKFRDFVYKQDSLECDNIYIVKSGEFLMYKTDRINIQEKQNQERNNSNDKKQIKKNIALLSQGELFGNYEAFEKIPRSHYSQCNSDHGTLIVISLSTLYQKLSFTSEQNYVAQLKNLGLRRNLWHKRFLSNIEKTQEQCSQLLNATDCKYTQKQFSMTECHQEEIDQKQQSIEIQDSLQQQNSEKLHLNLQFITQAEDIISPVKQVNIGDSPKIIKLQIPEAQPQTQLPKIKLVTNRMQDQERLSTPDRFNKIIQNKLTITRKIHNISPDDDSINLNTLQQKTILVPLPKQIQLEQKNKQQWPIKVSLYLNDLDDSIRYHSNSVSVNQSQQNSNSIQCTSRNSSIQSQRKNSQNCSERKSKLNILNTILQHSVSKRGKNKKKKEKEFILGFRQYLEQQRQMDQSLNSLQFS